MPVERREQVIAFGSGSTGSGRSPVFNGTRQPSRGGTSRMNREVHVRICEGLGVKFPGSTRQTFGVLMTLTIKAGMPRNRTGSGRRLQTTHADALCKQRRRACATDH
jgi:hypothetical protein